MAADPITLSFTLNDTPRTVEVAADLPLVWVLRDLLGGDAVRIGCGRDTSCGACIVRVDGERRNSCALRADAVQGAVITTVGYRRP